MMVQRVEVPYTEYFFSDFGIKNADEADQGIPDIGWFLHTFEVTQRIRVDLEGQNQVRISPLGQVRRAITAQPEPVHAIISLTGNYIPDPHKLHPATSLTIMKPVRSDLSYRRSHFMIPETITRIFSNMQRVIVGKIDVLELAMAAVLCEGHILVEDVPGIGKTTLAKTLARSLGCSFQRIQCTPDLLPSDITGVNFFNQKTCEFEFRPGPVMANIVLIDEINRATPRTQSSLLECMEERQVTVDGKTMPLPRPFVVVATQNPVELHGTFPLPEAQLDRFLLKLKLGYPEKEEEDALLLRFEKDNPLEKLASVTSGEEVLDLISLAREVYIEKSVRHYILDIIRETRRNKAVELGASPRASLMLYKAAQAMALVKGRDYVLPDDVKNLVVPVLGHRLVLSSEAYLHNTSKETLIESIVNTLPVPVEG